MARTIHERMAAYRLRQRVSGLATLSLIVPAEDAVAAARLLGVSRDVVRYRMRNQRPDERAGD